MIDKFEAGLAVTFDFEAHVSFFPVPPESVHAAPAAAAEIVFFRRRHIPEIFGDLTVLENMMIPCFAKRDGAFRMHALESIAQERDIIEKSEQMLEDMNLIDKRHMHAAAMSRGDKRRLEMAMCLVQEPRLLLLDEPMAALDRKLRKFDCQ
mgnify:CR=1 FL=1